MWATAGMEKYSGSEVKAIQDFEGKRGVESRSITECTPGVLRSRPTCLKLFAIF